MPRPPHSLWLDLPNDIWWWVQNIKRSQHSSVSIVSDYGLDDRCSIPGRDKRVFPLASVWRLALGRTQPPVQWVQRGRGVTLPTHPHILPKCWKSRSYTSSVPCAL
jgi:hypothetical protein